MVRNRRKVLVNFRMWDILQPNVIFVFLTFASFHPRDSQCVRPI